MAKQFAETKEDISSIIVNFTDMKYNDNLKSFIQIQKQGKLCVASLCLHDTAKTSNINVSSSISIPEAYRPNRTAFFCLSDSGGHATEANINANGIFTYYNLQQNYVYGYSNISWFTV